MAWQVILTSFVKALRNEADAQRQQGGHPIEVVEGQLLDSDVDGGTYRFTIHVDVFLPDGVPVELVVSKGTYAAEILHREGDQLYLAVSWSPLGSRPPETIANATIKAQPWFLLEELAKRLDGLTGQDASGSHDSPLGVSELLLDKIHRAGPATAGSSTPQRVPPVSLGSLNPYQQAAIAACAAEPLWFVWGPPGTGKTRTLGHLVARLASERETVLVAAHANVAVDAAVLAVWEALKDYNVEKDLYEAIVRAGPAALPEVRRLGVSSRDRALARRPDLQAMLHDLEAHLKELAGHDSRRSQHRR